MNSLLLDLIVPGGRRPPRVIHDVVVGRVDDIQKTDSLNDGGNSVVDTLQQAACCWILALAVPHRLCGQY